jgi:hypothetical protein
MGAKMMDDKMSDEQFDELWSAALEQSYQIEVPDPGPSWEKVSKIITAERAARLRKKRIQTASAVTAALLLGALIFGSPEKTSAYLPVVKFVNDIKGGVMNIFYGEDRKDKGNGLTSPPPVDNGQPQTQVGSGNREPGPQGDNGSAFYQTLEEAQKNTTFTLLQPGEVPEGYRMIRVELHHGISGKVGTAMLIYENMDKSPLVIKESTIEDKEKIGQSVDPESGIDKIKIGNTEGFLISKGNGRMSLNWIAGNIDIVITGLLSEDEMIRFGRSIK